MIAFAQGRALLAPRQAQISTRRQQHHREDGGEYCGINPAPGAGHHGDRPKAHSAASQERRQSLNRMRVSVGKSSLTG
jgi:hypothetical protein